MRKKIGKDIYEFIKLSISRRGYPPTTIEIAKKFSISTSTAFKYIRKLQELGFINIRLSNSKMAHRGIRIGE